MQLLPVSLVFHALERAVRDAAILRGKSVAFESSGGTTRVDADVLGVVQAALLHAVRNAVAHGIEDPAQRRLRDKPPQGRVILEVKRSGHRVAFVCRDDGRGLDLEAVRRAARRARPETDGKELGESELVDLLLKGGISTSTGVNEVAGRGVGLDVVRESAVRLGGEVALRTVDGQGLTLELTVPVMLVDARRPLRPGRRAPRRHPARIGEDDVSPRPRRAREGGARRRARGRRRDAAVRLAGGGPRGRARSRRRRGKRVRGRDRERRRARARGGRPAGRDRERGAAAHASAPTAATGRDRASCTTPRAVRSWVLDPHGLVATRARRTAPVRRERPPILVDRRLADHADARAEHPRVGGLRRRSRPRRAKRGSNGPWRGATVSFSWTSRCRGWTASPSSSAPGPIPRCSACLPSSSRRGARRRTASAARRRAPRAYVVKGEFDQRALLAKIRRARRMNAAGPVRVLVVEDSLTMRRKHLSRRWRPIPGSRWWATRATGGAAWSCASGCARTS